METLSFCSGLLQGIIILCFSDSIVLKKFQHSDGSCILASDPPDFRQDTNKTVSLFLQTRIYFTLLHCEYE